MYDTSQLKAGNSYGAEIAPAQPLSGKISNALDTSQMILSRLSAVADRTFGSVPTPADTSTSPMVNTTDRTMDQLTDMLSRIAAVANRLEAGL